MNDAQLFFVRCVYILQDKRKSIRFCCIYDRNGQHMANYEKSHFFKHRSINQQYNYIVYIGFKLQIK